MVWEGRVCAAFFSGRILALPPDREPSSARSGPERNGARKQIQRYLRS